MSRVPSLLALAAVVLTAGAAVALAQPPPPSAPPQVPVDGGLGLLARAGGAYAVKRLRRTE
ncbi:MAG: hypothetical protein AAF845_14355 [Bacteroidota bacterium]